MVIAAIVMLAVDGETATAPTQTPSPTQYARRLTAAGAGILLESGWNHEVFTLELDQIRDYESGGSQTLPTGHVRLENCDAVEFNEFTHVWVVECETVTYLLLGGAGLSLDREETPSEVVSFV